MPYLFDAPPHEFPDRAHRHLLMHPQNLRELVEQAAPAAAAALAFERAHLLQRALPLPDWRKRENDLFFEVPCKVSQPDGVSEVLVGVLLEHQTKPDPALPLRTLVYATGYWDVQWQAWVEIKGKKKPPLRLTPVLPIVFHAGPRRWKTHRTLADLFEPPEPFRSFVPVWQPLFWHLFEQPPDVLLQAGPWLQAMAVVRLDEAKGNRFQAVWGEVLHRLEPLAAQDKMRWHDLICFLIAWSQYRRQPQEWPALDTVTEASIMDSALREEVKTMSQTLRSPFLEWAEKHYGTLGESRGELRARRDDLRTLLEDRFGTLPHTLVLRMEATEDVERLKAAVRQVSHLKSLDELRL